MAVSLYIVLVGSPIVPVCYVLEADLANVVIERLYKCFKLEYLNSTMELCSCCII